MSRNRLFSLALVLVLVLAAFGTVAPSTSFAQSGTPAATSAATSAATLRPGAKPIKVGLHVPLTGPLAFLGEGYQMGVTLAIEDLGKQVEGYPIELVVADNKGNPTDTVNAVRKLIDVDKVDVIIGGGSSGASVAAMPVLLEGEVPAVDGSSTTPKLWADMGVGGNPWFFRMNPDDTIMAQAFAGFISKQVKSISLVAENNDYGRGGAGAYKPFFEKAGLKVVSEDYFDNGTADYRPALTKIKSANPEALLIVMTEKDASTFMRQLREVGLTQKLFSRGSIASPLFLDYTKDDPTIGNGVMEFSFWAAGEDPKQDANFQKRWDKPNTPHRAMSYYVMTYAVANAIRDVVKSGKDITRENIREALTKLNMDTPVGPLKFDDHNQNYPNGTISTIEGGKIKFVDTVKLMPVEGRK